MWTETAKSYRLSSGKMKGFEISIELIAVKELIPTEWFIRTNFVHMNYDSNLFGKK